MKLYLKFCCAYMLLSSLFSTNNRVYAQYDPRPVFKGIQGKTLADSKQWFPEKLETPGGAPNVIWILLDDVGLDASEAFGVLTIEQEIK